ncbi:hypothetical protein FEAC_10510 [Ferrimicrobium acidiphilum DSM 19497]|uniref:Uncharacterized protein n=1 Tax=Ferrimicrobium acidiphilum DSM 19497 TaxID=1121877 RepID=A0A0D8FVH0_9ACTN|nr:hypothetical protein FEAC_10510 [Ferrimicrobium acidiphilum DSM 19497]
MGEQFRDQLPRAFWVTCKHFCIADSIIEEGSVSVTGEPRVQQILASRTGLVWTVEKDDNAMAEGFLP